MQTMLRQLGCVGSGMETCGVNILNYGKINVIEQGETGGCISCPTTMHGDEATRLCWAGRAKGGQNLDPYCPILPLYVNVWAYAKGIILISFLKIHIFSLNSFRA